MNYEPICATFINGTRTFGDETVEVRRVPAPPRVGEDVVFKSVVYRVNRVLWHSCVGDGMTATVFLSETGEKL